MHRVVYFLLLLILVPALAVAQVGIAFEFSLSNPGARSMGFGGAFVALADDATAAFANPAGLVQVAKPELSAELRHWSYSVPFTFTGRLSGAPTGMGLDTKGGVYFGNYDDVSTGLSFLSFVYPRKHLTLAFYRHLSANFQVSSFTQGLFAEGEGPFDTFRLVDRVDYTEIKTAAYGLSAATKLIGNLSLGLTLTYYDGLLTGNQTRYLWDEDSLQGYFGPTSFLPERWVSGTEFIADGSDVSFNVGLLWHFSQNWFIGVSYRRAPTFDLDLTLTAGPASGDPELPPGETYSTTSSVAYPNVLGAGIAFRSPDDRLTLSFEWDRVEYSRIFESLTATTSGEYIPDGTEIHLGSEYAFLKLRPVLALRAGMWLDPNHQVRSEIPNQVIQGLLGTGGDEMHFTFGIGAAFSRFQVDFAVDHADRQDTISLSGIYSW